MSSLREQLEELAIRKRYWSLLLLGAIPAVIPVIESYFSLSLREALEHWSLSVFAGATLIVSGCLTYALEFFPKRQELRRHSIYSRPGGWALILRNRVRFVLGLAFILVGSYFLVAGVLDYMPPTLPDNTLVVTILRFSPISPSATDDGDNVPHRIEEMLLEKIKLGAPLQVKRLRVAAEGVDQKEKEGNARKIGLSKKGFANIVIWGEVRRDEGQLYVKPNITIAQQLRKNRIQERQVSATGTMEPSDLTFKERLSKDLADVALCLFGLAYFNTGEWDQAIEIFRYVDFDEGYLYRGIALFERSATGSNGRSDLESSVKCFERLFPSDRPTLLGNLHIYASENLGLAYARLAEFLGPEDQISMLRKALEFSRIANHLSGNFSANSRALILSNLSGVLTSLALRVRGKEAGDLMRESQTVLAGC
jgi:tetratricopeptide (TPR) repeat protein